MSTDITNDSTTDGATTVTTSTDAGHEAHEAHEVSDKGYIVIALLLAVLTALEVAATEVDGLGAFLVPALLIMMAIKFFIVVSYFMHLKHDSALFKFSFYVGLAGALVLYSIMLTTFHFFID
jgi:cytochrome c oxidase subunit 4